MAALLALAGVVAAATGEGSAGAGPLLEVAVARRPLAPGTVIGEGDVEWRLLPTAAVAPGAVVDPAGGPVGRTVLHAVEPGEPIAAGRLTPPGVGGPAALTGPSRRAVRLRDDTVAPALAIGQRVDLFGAAAASVGTTAEPVARDAAVIAIDESGVTVAVDERHAASVAGAVLDGRVVVVARTP